jgi:hypothetical protein
MIATVLLLLTTYHGVAGSAISASSPYSTPVPCTIACSSVSSPVYSDVKNIGTPTSDLVALPGDWKRAAEIDVNTKTVTELRRLMVEFKSELLALGVPYERYSRRLLGLHRDTLEMSIPPVDLTIETLSRPSELTQDDPAILQLDLLARKGYMEPLPADWQLTWYRVAPYVKHVYMEFQHAEQMHASDAKNMHRACLTFRRLVHCAPWFTAAFPN